MNDNLKNNFRLFMLPLRSPNIEWSPQYRSALECWRNVWLPVQERFNIPGALTSDAFLRQDEGAFMFCGDRCVGILLFRIMNFNVLDYSKDSYFKDWPAGELDRLRQEGQSLFLATNLSVDPEFRNFHPEIKFKQVLMNFMIRRFHSSDADLIVNAARRDRAVNDEGFKRGGILLTEDIKIFDGQESIDLVYYTKMTACEPPEQELTLFTNHLWENRVDWQPISLSQEYPLNSHPKEHSTADSRKVDRVQKAS